MTDHEKIDMLTGVVDALIFHLWSKGLLDEGFHDLLKRTLREVKDVSEPHPLGSHDRQGDWL